MFRSRFGTSSPDRYFPQISDVVNNNITPTWEVVPSVARTLNFALTVRDNKAGGGQTSDDLMRVTVNGTAGPFVVTAPNTAITWIVGSSQTVTWNVAGTSASPISTANVNILAFNRWWIHLSCYTVKQYTERWFTERSLFRTT